MLGHTASAWPPAGLGATDHNLLGLVFQPVFNPLHLSNVYFVSLSVTLAKTLSFVRLN